MSLYPFQELIRFRGFAIKIISGISLLWIFIGGATNLTHAQKPSNKFEEFRAHLNHANSYYWLSRSRFNSIEESRIALQFLDSARHALQDAPLAPKEKSIFLNQIQREEDELNVRISASLENLNAHMPLVPYLKGYFDSQFGFYDNGSELALEDALDNLLKTKLIRPSSLINELPGIVVVDSPVRDSSNLVEVVKQFIASNSKLYIVADHELKSYFGDSSYTLSGVGALFNTGFVGRFNFNVQDEYNNLYYCGVRFDYYDLGKNELMSSTYSESIQIKKDGIIIPYLKVYLALVFVMIFIFSGYGFWRAKQKVNGLLMFYKTILAIGLGFSGGFLIGLGLLRAMRFLPIDPVAYLNWPFDISVFFTEPNAWVWPVCFIVLFSNTPFLFWLLSTLILKRKLVQDPFAIFSFFVFSFMGILFFLGKEYIFYFEQRPSTFLIIHAFVSVAVGAALHSKAVFHFYRKNSALSSLPLLFPSLFPLYAFYMQYLLSSPISDFNWILFAFSFGAILFYFIKKTHILKIIKSRGAFHQKSKRHYGMPNLLSELDDKINRQLTAESAEGIIPFKTEYVAALNNLVQDQGIHFHHIHIEGQSGVGKTTFIKAFMKDYQESPTRSVFYGDCDEKEGTAIPYEPFHEALSEITGSGIYYSGDLVALAAIEKTKPLLDGVPGGLLLNAVSHSSSDGSGFKGAKVREISEEIVASIRSLHVKHGVEQVILIIEDVQWMDERSEELFRFLWKSLLLAVEENEPFPRVLFITSSSTDSNETRSNAHSFIHHKAKTAAGSNENISFLIEGHSEMVKLTVWDDQQDKLPRLSDLSPGNFVEKWFSASGMLPNIDDGLMDGLKEFLAESEVFSPRYFLQLLQFLIQSKLIEEKNQSLVASSSLQWDKIPLESATDVYYRTKFERLDPNLIKFLESAAFIGPQFEAAVLAKIWKIDKIELVHQLLVAEKAGLVIDLNEKDDYYSFSNKKVRHALKQFALRDSKVNAIPQIVKEYHKAIIGIKIGISELTFEQHYAGVISWDYDLLQDLANRVVIIKREMGANAEIILAAAGIRSFEQGEHARALNYFKHLNLGNPSLWIHQPSLGRTACRVILMSAQSGKAEDLLHTFQRQLFSVLIKKLPNTPTLDIVDAYAESYYLLCFWQGKEWDDSFFNEIPEKEVIEFYRLNLIDRNARREQEKGVDVETARLLYQSFLLNERLKNSAMFSKVLDLMAKIDLEKHAEHLSKRMTLIRQKSVNIDNPDTLHAWIETLNVLEYPYQTLEDLAYCLSTLNYSTRISLTKSLKKQLNQKRLEINRHIGHEWGCYLSEFELLSIGEDNWTAEQINHRFRKAFLEYRMPKQRLAILILWMFTVHQFEGGFAISPEMQTSLDQLCRIIERDLILLADLKPVEVKIAMLKNETSLPSCIQKLFSLIDAIKS
jgi:hypothetical protein